MTNPFLVPFDAWQRGRLTTNLWCLWQAGDLTEALAEGARLRWGATRDELHEILSELGVEIGDSPETMRDFRLPEEFTSGGPVLDALRPSHEAWQHDEKGGGD